MENKKQNINCDVYSCKHCNCDEEHCDLSEVEIKNQSGVASSEKGTICSSYELDDEKLED